MGDDSFDDSFDDRDSGPERGNDDFDDSFDDTNFGGGGGADPMAKSQLVSNQPYDEAVALSEDDSVDSLASPNRGGGAAPVAAAAPEPERYHASCPPLNHDRKGGYLWTLATALAP